VRRLRRELGEFAVIANKKYFNDLSPDDVTAYWTWLREKRKCAPRTVFNRIQSLQTFLRECGASTLLLKKNQMPKFDERAVDYFNENEPSELEKFFAACSAEEKLAFQFFLFSGAREREVSYAAWVDLDFVNRTFSISAKPDLGFHVKNREIRTIPLPQSLVDGLKDYAISVPPRRLIFANGNGGPQGHFLYRCKQIAFTAGLNCGFCVNKQGKSCGTHASCSKFSLHKFRRTFAMMHLLAGTPVTVIQNYLGHCDLSTIHRYLGHISAKSDLAKTMTESMALMTRIQGTITADALARTVKL
jgi:integrase/recombinase XerD